MVKLECANKDLEEIRINLMASAPIRYGKKLKFVVCGFINTTLVMSFIRVLAYGS